jgi:hypothetical protein
MPVQPNSPAGISLVFLVPAVAVPAFLLLLAVILMLLLRRGVQRKEPPPVDLRVNLQDLPAGGPPAVGPRLEFYGTPVRLAVLVLAPAGRRAENADPPPLAQLYEHVVPGLAEVVAAHRPLIRLWPGQLSTRGFTTSFFHHVRLPGDRGKGTPWCSAAGRFEAGPQQYLAGVLCVADQANSLSQVTVEHAGDWPGVLRVHHPPST